MRAKFDMSNDYALNKGKLCLLTGDKSTLHDSDSH